MSVTIWSQLINITNQHIYRKERSWEAKGKTLVVLHNTGFVYCYWNEDLPERNTIYCDVYAVGGHIY